MKNYLKTSNSKLYFNKNVLIIFYLLFAFLKVNAQKAKLKVGDRVPYFFLYDQNGNEFNTKDYIGKKAIVLFFYPKDNAPVCEAQVCSFRDNYSKFTDIDAVVVGVNPGYLVNHKEFSVKNNLQFPILADKNNKVQKLFGVPKLFLSKSPKRYTFIIDKYGVIKYIYYSRKANVNKHIEESLRVLKEE